WRRLDFKTCTQRPSDSFILLKPERVPPESIRIFYEEMPGISGDVEAEAMASLGDQALLDQTDWATPNFWTTLFKTETIGPALLQNYLRRHILGCENAI